MKIIGITGGIGSGKTTASDHLRALGYPVIDADELSRNATAKGQPALALIAEAFGKDVILPDGSLDRKKVASIVFDDPEKKQVLQKIVFAEIGKETNRLFASYRERGEHELVFYDAPLLFETRAREMTDSNWLITCDEDIRIARVVRRDDTDPESVRKRIAAQMPEEEKKRLADEILDNSEDQAHLYEQIDRLLRKYDPSLA